MMWMMMITEGMVMIVNDEDDYNSDAIKGIIMTIMVTMVMIMLIKMMIMMLDNEYNEREMCSFVRIMRENPKIR